jgi:hypothetical protein
MEYWAPDCQSLRPEACELDHPAPFLNLGCHMGPELRGSEDFWCSGGNCVNARAYCRGAVSLVALRGSRRRQHVARPLVKRRRSGREMRRSPQRAGPRQRNISRIMSLFIAATKTSPISPAMFKSRDTASRASISIAAEGSGISVVFSLPLCRIIAAKLAKCVAQAVGCDTSFCSRTCAMPTEPGVGIVPPLTSAVRRPEPLAEIIRRKLMPNLEQVTWRDPTVTPTRLAISSRLIPNATKPLICSITCGVNLTRLPLAGGLAFVIVMAAPL